METLDQLIKLRNDLANVGDLGSLDMSQRCEVGRMLDSIAETAAVLRGALDYGSGTKRAGAFRRRVRKALGYTYP